MPLGGLTSGIPSLARKAVTQALATIIISSGVVFVWQNSSGDSMAKVDQNGNLTLSGAIISETGGTLGFTIQSSANQACTTTCEHACVVGWDTSATQSDIVACDGSTADECLCAGPS